MLSMFWKNVIFFAVVGALMGLAVYQANAEETASAPVVAEEDSGPLLQMPCCAGKEKAAAEAAVAEQPAPAKEKVAGKACCAKKGKNAGEGCCATTGQMAGEACACGEKCQCCEACRSGEKAACTCGEACQCCGSCPGEGGETARKASQGKRACCAKAKS